MTFLFLDPREERQTQQRILATPSDPKALEPGLFDGTLSGIDRGFGRAGAIAGQLLGEVQYGLGSVFVTQPLDALFGTDMTGWLDENMRQAPRRLTASMVPDPISTGTVGNILYSLIGIGAPAVAGTALGGPVGGALAAGTFQGTGTYTDLTAQGVDPLTATGAAALDATLTGVGVGLPGAVSIPWLSAGKNVAFNTLAFGPGVNVAQDLVAGQAMGAVLDARGYGELADRYSTIHGEMIAADIILGGVFGYAGARGNRPRVTVRSATEAADVAMTAAAVKHVEIDTAPGLLADVAALQQHTRNLESATEALLDGRRVETDPLDGPVVPKPENTVYAPDALVRALRESGLPEMLDEVDALEAALARRGIELTDEPLPDVPQEARARADEPAAAPEPEAPPARAAAQEEAPAASVVPEGPDVSRFTAKTKAGEFTLTDRPAPAGTDFSEFGQVRVVEAFDGEQKIGELVYANDGTPPTIEVDEAYRRRGVGTAMLKLAKQQGGVLGDAKGGIRGRGAEYRTPAGQAFRTGADEGAVQLAKVEAKAKPESAAGAGAKAAKLEPGEAGMQARAADVVDMDPDLVVVDENGVERSVADLMAEADAAIARANQDAPGFDAAVSCFIGSST
jgi:GNAT superfamily N-acetyltransferase